MNKKKEDNVLSVIRHVIGDFIVSAIICIAISKLIPRLSGTINKIIVKQSNVKHVNDEWGPTIERKN